MILKMKVWPLLAISPNLRHTSRHFWLCVPGERKDTSFAAMWCVLKFSMRISWQIPLLTPAMWKSWWNVWQLSSWISQIASLHFLTFRWWLTILNAHHLEQILSWPWTLHVHSRTHGQSKKYSPKSWMTIWRVLGADLWASHKNYAGTYYLNLSAVVKVAEQSRHKVIKLHVRAVTCRQYNAKLQIDSLGLGLMIFSVPHIFVEWYSHCKYSPGSSQCHLVHYLWK